MFKETELKRPMLILLSVSLIARILLAIFLELGPNEAYYWTHALYPDTTHFDQPPMLGWLIQLFTINLYFDSEFFVRLPSIIIGTINIWLIFIIGRRVKNSKTGFYSALLFAASPYCSILTGIFITPDTPLTIFFLLSLYFLVEGIFPKYGLNRESVILARFASIISAIFIGLAMLSKFGAIMIWVSVIVYALIAERDMIKRPILYISASISMLMMAPIILWNLSNGFTTIGIYNHSVFSWGDANLHSLLSQLWETVKLNNPFNILIIIIAIFSYKKNVFIEKRRFIFLLSISLTIILSFLLLSLFMTPDSHLSAPGFLGLILIAGAWMESRFSESKKVVPGILKVSLSFMAIITLAGFAQTEWGVFSVSKKGVSISEKFDPTLKLYGDKQLSKRFSALFTDDIRKGVMNRNSGIIATNWSDAARLDYYVAYPEKISVKTIAPVNYARKYSWITEYKGGFTKGESYYYIAFSGTKSTLPQSVSRYFTVSDTAAAFYIKRAGVPITKCTIYRLKNLKELPVKELTTPIKAGIRE